MLDQDRIRRLRAIVAQLERQPPSERRDALLREARARIVALETAMEPRSWRPPAPSASRRALERRLLGMS
jgi:DNA invertase Pin-like site-specific DNA recombinase